jgi:probable F420-dependent oxidoreductase
MKFDVNMLPAPLNGIPAAARAAEQIGFDAIWTSETAHNPFLPLTHVAAATERIALGTGIAVAFPRSPMVTAQIAWDLAAQSQGRFILGLGTQVKQHITKRFSTSWEAPVERLREYLAALRAIWRSFQTGAALRYAGAHYRFSLLTPFFNPGPISHPDIPIYIAGVNERLCQLAGEACDGFHVHPFHTPHYLRQVIVPAVERGALSSGRSRADIQLACAIFVLVGENDAEIDANAGFVRAQIAFYASTPSYRAVMDLHGWGALHEQLNALSRAGQWNEMGALVSDEMLHAFAVAAPASRLATAVHARYHGLLDRVAYYFPFDPADAQQHALWADAIRTFHLTSQGAK